MKYNAINPQKNTVSLLKITAITHIVLVKYLF